MQSGVKQLLLFFFACLLSATAVTAQDCSGFYYFQQHKVTTMTVYDRKEKTSGTYVYRVIDVKRSANKINSVVEGEMNDEKGRLLSRNTAHMLCQNGVYLVDMKLLLPQQQQEQFKNMELQSDFYLEYPARMAVGDQLKEGNFNASVKNDKGPGMDIEMIITDRIVAGEEEVTTPAGTWKCFRIRSRYKIRTKVGGIGIPFQVDNAEWFAPGFGIVKTASKWGSTMITAIQ